MHTLQLRDLAQARRSWNSSRSTTPGALRIRPIRGDCELDEIRRLVILMLQDTIDMDIGERQPEGFRRFLELLDKTFRVVKEPTGNPPRLAGQVAGASCWAGMVENPTA